MTDQTDHPYRGTNDEDAVLRYQIGYYQSALHEIQQSIVGINGFRGIPGLDRLHNHIEEILGRKTASYEAEAADLNRRAKRNKREYRKLDDVVKQRDGLHRQLAEMRKQFSRFHGRPDRGFAEHVGHWLDTHPYITWPALIALIAFIVALAA